MASTPQSRKQKGRVLQQWVRDKILSTFTSLEPDDVVSTSMGAAGTDIKLSPAAKRLFPYAVECKNQEALQIWSAIEQAEANATETTTPVVFFKRNRSKTYVVIEAEHFLGLTKHD